tara:strand:+ start:358 stop:585 length:228 start_codon:yes stop_codon:yes gene_type:complete
MNLFNKNINDERIGFTSKPKLNLHILIFSYLPFIGIIWASERQLKNKLYALWYWFISMIGGAIAFVKVGMYFNWL